VSIQDIVLKIKAYFQSEKGKDIAIIGVLIITAFGSFGLGRLSKSEESTIPLPKTVENGTVDAVTTVPLPAQPIAVQTTALQAKAVSTAPSSVTGNYVASKRGKRYYSVSCTGAKNLAEANKIYFATEAEAETAGYSKSASCPDL